MTIHGITWQYMAFHGNTLRYMAVHGYTLYYTAIHGYTCNTIWLYMALNGIKLLYFRRKVENQR